MCGMNATLRRGPERAVVAFFSEKFLEAAPGSQYPFSIAQRTNAPRGEGYLSPHKNPAAMTIDLLYLQYHLSADAVSTTDEADIGLSLCTTHHPNPGARQRNFGAVPAFHGYLCQCVTHR